MKTSAAVLLLSATLNLAAGAPVRIEPRSRNVLLGADAQVQGQMREQDIGLGKRGWLEGWKDAADSLVWTIDVPQTADYEILAIAEGGGDSRSLQLDVAGRQLRVDLSPQWDRLTFGKVRLPAGSTTLQLRSPGAMPVRRFFSLELLRPETKADLERRARKLDASTEPLMAGKYGLMFHWTSDSKPREGPAKPYQNAVRDFDAVRFANMVAETGAGHVVFTTSHAGMYFPGPNAVMDEILPGRTCDRDLVADLAAELGKRGIRLWLYFHPGHDDNEWWKRTYFEQDKKRYFEQWIRIVSEIGQRYGKRIAGFWFDDAIFTYYPYQPPWEQMTRAAKAGNPDRLVTYNSWILPRVCEFYEVFAGESEFSREMIEGHGYLPVGGSGKFTGGPQAGLQGHITTFIEQDWGHFKRDTPIGPPQFTAAEMIAKVQDAVSRRNVPTIDVEIYQDGAISPATLSLLKAVRQAIKGR
jgi:hypothetical protein